MGKCLFLRKGETHTAPISVILASDLAVGSSVYLMENGTAAEYLVVHQGLPSSLYDASCDGTWLLRKDIYTKGVWGYEKHYANSSVHSFLNSQFLALFDADIQNVIKQVKIPYVTDPSNGYVSGSDGVSTKIFLLDCKEAGTSLGASSGVLNIGSILSYFISVNTTDANNKRIAFLNNTATNWWTRTSATGNYAYTFIINTSGAFQKVRNNLTQGIRPALILPSNALFDKNTLILKGVA